MFLWINEFDISGCETMRVLIRADASAVVGTGHLMRCITLANGLQERGAEVTFACAPLPLEISRLIQESGSTLKIVGVMENSMQRGAPEAVLSTGVQASDAAATVSVLSQRQFDWIVVDHYGFDVCWESRMRSHGNRILVIDDLANRRHLCDLLLDQNLGVNKEVRYRALVSPAARLLLGPRYALLRPEFAAARAHIAPRVGNLDRILVMFGGSDPTDEATKAIQALKRIPGVAQAIDVVAGGANPHGEKLRRECASDTRMKYFSTLTDVPAMMTRADLALGACGVTTWERCALYLPTVAVVVAENQREIANELAAAGAAEVVGWHANVGPEDLAAAVAHLAVSRDRLRTLSLRAGDLVDGGGVHRVLESMEETSAHPPVLH